MAASPRPLIPINLWNLDKKLTQTDPTTLAWEALTTGGFGGFDAWLTDAQSGTLRIDTTLVKGEIAVADIGLDELIFEAGGIGRRIRVFRLPDENRHRQLPCVKQTSLFVANPASLSLSDEMAWRNSGGQLRRILAARHQRPIAAVYLHSTPP